MSGTDAVERRRVRVRYVVAAAVCLGAIAWLLYTGLGSSIVYLRPVSEAVERRDDQGDERFRMGGAVVPGSIDESGGTVRFEMTEGGATVAVVHEGDTPDLFRDGAPIVCEGRWDGEVFACDRVLIRHGNEYSPPTVDAPAGGVSSSDVDPGGSG